MKSMSLKQYTFVLIFLMVFILLFVLGFVIFPSINNIAALKNDITLTQEQLEKRYQDTRRLKRSLSELSNIKLKTEKFKEIVVSGGEELDIIVQLEQLAQQHNIVQTLNIRYSESLNSKQKKRTRPYYELSFLSHGSLEQVMSYVKALEKLPYYIIIDSMHWQKTSAETGTDAILTLRFDGLIYTD